MLVFMLTNIPLIEENFQLKTNNLNYKISSVSNPSTKAEKSRELPEFKDSSESIFNEAYDGGYKAGNKSGEGFKELNWFLKLVIVFIVISVISIISSMFKSEEDK